jgi:hypothetical protein
MFFKQSFNTISIQMDINRNNYETYFLLYLDDELTHHQRKTVELFIDIHLDLKVEFENLKSIKIPDDELLFFNKKNLYQSTISDNDLMLYIDKELNEKLNLGIENSIKNNPKLKAKLAQFKNCKLTDEFIECPNKISLYKKDKNPIILLFIKRITAVAAILLLVILCSPVFQKFSKSKENETEMLGSSNKDVDIKNSHQTIISNIKNNSIKTSEKKTIKLNNQKIKDTAEIKSIPNEIAKVEFSTTQFYQPKAELVKIEILKNASTTIGENNINKVPPINNFEKLDTNNLSAIALNVNESNNILYVANLKLNKAKISNFLTKIHSPKILKKVIEL